MFHILKSYFPNYAAIKQHTLHNRDLQILAKCRTTNTKLLTSVLASLLERHQITRCTGHIEKTDHHKTSLGHPGECSANNLTNDVCIRACRLLRFCGQLTQLLFPATMKWFLFVYPALNQYHHTDWPVGRAMAIISSAFSFNIKSWGISSLRPR